MEGVEVAVPSVEAFDAAARRRARSPLAVHVKARHGHGPLGDGGGRARSAAELADGTGPLRLGGLMSHLASADVERELHRRAARAVRRGSPSGSRPARATSPTAPRRWAVADARFDAVRCGIAVYGALAVRRRPGGARPARRPCGFESYVAQVKRLRAGREHRLRPPLHRPSGRSGSGWRRPATPTACRGCCRAGWTCSCGGRRRRVVATISMDQLTFLIGEQCDVEPWATRSC